MNCHSLTCKEKYQTLSCMTTILLYSCYFWHFLTINLHYRTKAKNIFRGRNACQAIANFEDFVYTSFDLVVLLTFFIVVLLFYGHFLPIKVLENVCFFFIRESHFVIKKYPFFIVNLKKVIFIFSFGSKK